MFGIEDGFDIVIGNPPYVNVQRASGSANLKRLGYKTYEASGDIYSLFYEAGNKMLRTGGVVCYITSNKWINAAYGKSTRRYFTEHTNPLLLIDFAKVRIFDTATVFVNILLFAKGRNENRLKACTIAGYKLPEGALRDYVGAHAFPLENLGDSVWKVSNAAAQGLNARILERGVVLKAWKDISFYRGITTGLNEAFHITKAERDALVRANKKNKEIIKPLLRGKDIKRWKYRFEDWYIIFTKHSVNISEYPEVRDHLRNFYKELVPKKTAQDKVGRKPGSYKWYEIQDIIAYHEDFEKPKIVWIEISDRANYAYDETGKYLTNSAYFMTGKGLKYVMAVLNSRVADYYFFQLTATIAGGRKRYTGQFVEEVPVPQISEAAQGPFVKLVDYILYLKSCEDALEARLATGYFEAMLDLLVMELYFEAEIKGAGLSIQAEVAKLPLLAEAKGLEGLLAIYKKLYHQSHPVRNAVFTVEVLPALKEITSVYRSDNHSKILNEPQDK